MSAFLPQSPGSSPGSPDLQESVEPRDRRATHQARWSLQAARWQAVALAEEVFGEGVRSRLLGTPGREGFQGLLTLRVPFQDMQEHREREGLFLSAAGADPVLASVPLVFVFEADPETVAPTGSPSGSRPGPGGARPASTPGGGP